MRKGAGGESARASCGGGHYGLGQDCVLDPWHGLGTADRQAVAFMALDVAQMTHPDKIMRRFRTATQGIAAIMGLGAVASFVVMDAAGRCWRCGCGLTAWRRHQTAWRWSKTWRKRLKCDLFCCTAKPFVQPFGANPDACRGHARPFRRVKGVLNDAQNRTCCKGHTGFGSGPVV